jgi:hypothetical protein
LTDHSLVLEGAVAFPYQCCDISYLFQHSNVQAVIVPEPMTGFLVVIAFSVCFGGRHSRRPRTRRYKPGRGPLCGEAGPLGRIRTE